MKMSVCFFFCIDKYKGYRYNRVMWGVFPPPGGKTRIPVSIPVGRSRNG